MSQIAPASAQAAKEASARLATPMLARTAVGTKLNSEKRATAPGVAKLSRPLDQRLIR